MDPISMWSIIVNIYISITSPQLLVLTFFSRSIFPWLLKTCFLSCDEFWPRGRTSSHKQSRREPRLVVKHVYLYKEVVPCTNSGIRELQIPKVTTYGTQNKWSPHDTGNLCFISMTLNRKLQNSHVFFPPLSPLSRSDPRKEDPSFHMSREEVQQLRAHVNVLTDR